MKGSLVDGQAGAATVGGTGPGMSVMLTVVRGPDAGVKFRFGGTQATIGRKRGDLILSDRETSGIHCSVECTQDGRYVLKDLGSTNGTWLDGRKVAIAELSSGQQIRCGANFLLFTVGENESDGGETQTLDAPHAQEPPERAGVPAFGAPEALPVAPSPLALGDLELGDPDMPATAQRPAARLDEPLAAPAHVEIEAGPFDDVEAAALASVPGDALVFEVPPPAALAMPLPAAPAALPAAPPTGTRVAARLPVASPSWDVGDLLPDAAPRPQDARSVGEFAPSQARVPPAAPLSPEPVSAPVPQAWAAAPEEGVPTTRDWVPPALPPSLPGPSASSQSGIVGLPHLTGAATTREATPAPTIASADALPAGVEKSPYSAYLIVERGKDRGQVFPISRQVTVLGRSETDIVVNDSDVSRRHASLEVQGANKFLLRDLASTNGTLLNGIRVTQEAILSNDKIRMGGTTLKLIVGDERVQAELRRLQ